MNDIPVKLGIAPAKACCTGEKMSEIDMPKKIKCCSAHLVDSIWMR
jgi:hypothetical protein